jgi:peptidoglycan/LPS O-acetylase OafA/YrhL
MSHPKKEPNPETYFKNLNGLRFLCFLSVFFYHCFDTQFNHISTSHVYRFVKYGIFSNANLGVNFFFVLSGFLITFLITKEKQINGTISITKFWVRRVLRIWPLYFLAVFFGFVVFPVLKSFFGQMPSETASIWYYLTFLNNFDVIQKGVPDASNLGVLWSIAVEEQFYLVWPVILSALLIRQYWLAFVAVIAMSLIYRMLNDVGILYHYHTLSCIGDMAIGALGAWLISESPRFKSAMVNLSKFQIGIIYLAFASVFFFRAELFYKFYVVRVIERSVIAVVILLIVLEQCYARNSFFKLSNFKLISGLGRISYGLYCFHLIGILFAKTVTNVLGFNTELWQVLVLIPAVALLISIAISKVSYVYFETPFLKLKDERFSWRSKVDAEDLRTVSNAHPSGSLKASSS